MLCGSLELSSRNIVAGAVRLCYALMYSLFLGFGLAIGAEVYEKMTGLPIFGPEDYLCASSHSNAPWYRTTPSQYWGEPTPVSSAGLARVSYLLLTYSIPDRTHVLPVPQFAQPSAMVLQGACKLIIFR